MLLATAENLDHAVGEALSSPRTSVTRLRAG
jgi:hypothetical protein